jgi:Domain of unknown function (DUF6894)
MAQVLFHYSTPNGIVRNRHWAEVEDLLELREYAAAYIQKFISVPSLEDWRNWILHISDELDEELFSVPFSLFLSKPH